MTDPKLIKILQKVDLFQDTPNNVLEELATQVTCHEFKENQIIIRKGDEGDSLYIIASGIVRVHDGDMVVARMEAGNFFGEISFLDTAPRSMSVSADQPAILYRISRDDFYKVFKSQPEITQKIVSTLTQRLRSQNERVISDLKMREAELSKLVDERTQELVTKNDQLSKTLDELKATQEQLIQKEKLASLGQLTAGIAHEIKNPLNFVNNFARLSFELVDEIVEADAIEERKEVGEYLRQNLDKIYAHGTRADGIVKGMLEHTRSGGEGTKQLTNINDLCKQCLNMAYESLKSVKTDLEVDIQTNFENDLPRAEVTTVDFSKLLINIFNNAFYAVWDRRRKEGENYKAAVSVSTHFSNNRIMITVKDNGEGIPEDIKGLIFNPFYTTKPTGDGAGLGLSISHDIIMAHGGTIVCESEIGVGSIFMISVPVKVS